MRRILTALTVIVGGLAVTSAAVAQPPTAQIIGGSAVPAGAAPYAAFVQADAGVFSYSCTGTLVAPQYVLTAGHCMYDSAGAPLSPGAVHVDLGVTVQPDPGPNRRLVSAIHIYPNFNVSAMSGGDAALLTLATPAPGGATPIPLATTADAALYAAGQQVTIMGWGLTSNAATDVSPTLQSAPDIVLSNAGCLAASRGTGFSPSFDLCLANPGFSPAACHGDSGGPAVASTAAGAVELGLTSYSLGEACGQSPDYYTRVSSIQPWVASIVNGTATPPLFVPSFVAPSAAAALSADGVAATLADLADPATLVTGFSATLLDAAGGAVSTQALAATATSVTFPHVQPGTYTVSVSASYSEGTSAAGSSAPVTLAPPSNATRPGIKGKHVGGSKLTCTHGTWSWPGAATYAVTWLRGGRPTAATAASYRLRAADAGRRIACRVTLHTSTGAAAKATSASIVVAARLAARRLPRVSGTPAIGGTLTCAGGTWAHSGPLKLSYRWLRDGQPGGAPRATRTIAAADSGHRLSCRVTAATTGQQVSATSKPLLVTA